MKKLLSLALAAMLMLTMIAAVSAANFRTDLTVESLTKAPTVDGKITAGEYGKAVTVVNPENRATYGNGWGTDKAEAVPDASVYVNYDAKNLYVAVEVDTAHFLHNCCDTWWHGSQLMIQMSSANNIPANDAHGLSLKTGLNMYWDLGGNFVANYSVAEAMTDVTAGKKQADIGEIAHTVTEQDGGHKVVIETAFPWAKVMPLAKVPAKGDHFALSVIWYDADAEPKAAGECNVGARTAYFSAAGRPDGVNQWNWWDVTLGDAVAASTPSTPSTPSAPATFDAGIVAGAVALISAAGVMISKKRK